MTEYTVVLITVGTSEEAQKISQGLVEAHLAACVNVLPAIHSVYWWKGRAIKDTEQLLICKTAQDQWNELVKWVREHHSYEIPEIIQLPIQAGFDPYLTWIRNSLNQENAF